MQTSFRICEAVYSQTPMTKPGYVTHLNEAGNRAWPAPGKHSDTKGSRNNERRKQSALNNKKVKWISLMLNQAKCQQLFI